MMRGKPHFPRSRLHAQRGLSLIELMVAMTIGLFLMGAVVIIYVNTSTTSRSSTLESQMNEDASLALEVLQQQIRLAGFSSVDASGARLFPGRAVFGCEGTPSSTSDTAFESLACNAAGTGPDALAVRYEATVLNSQPVTNASGATVPGNCANEGIDPWDISSDGGATSATTLSLADNRYYIDNDADGTPSLFCRGRTGGGFGTAIALIPNIEDMQIQYAVTALPTAGNPIPHQVAGYVAANNAALGATAANWSRVAAIRICLLARSARTVPTGDNPVGTANPDGTTITPGLGTYVDCAGTSRTATDRFIRRAYVTTIQLRNMRPGLPADYAAGEDPWTYLYEN
jgi:type IV pilus assembly protein PilW